MNELKKLEAQRRDIMDRINEIQNAEKLKENRLLVGKCYKYDNGYNYDERWWLYLIIHGPDKDGYLENTMFQTNCNGNVEVVRNHFFRNDGSYIEISCAELMAEWEKTLKYVQEMIRFEL